MLKGFVRLAAVAASSVSFLALTGCGGTAPSELPTSAPPSAYQDTGERPELAGAPSPQDDGSGLLGGPARDASDIASASLRPVRPPPPGVNPSLVSYRRADGRLVVAMKPVANPEDMSPAERRRIYGNRYAPRAHVTASPRRQRLYAAAPAPRPVVAVAPKPVVKAAPKPVKAPASVPAAKAPVVVAKAPKPAPVIKAPAPVPAAKAPTVAAKAPAPVPATEAPATAPAPQAEKKSFSLPHFKLPKLALPAGMPKLDVLTIPGMPTIDLPGLGVTPSKYVVAGAALLLLLMLMAMASRAASARRRREERRRKFRTMTTFNEAETAPEPDHNYVSPMLAAAGGAVAGAAAHSYFSHHDAEDDHGHTDDHGHHEQPARETASEHAAHEETHAPADHHHEPEHA